MVSVPFAPIHKTLPTANFGECSKSTKPWATYCTPNEPQKTSTPSFQTSCHLHFLWPCFHQSQKKEQLCHFFVPSRQEVDEGGGLGGPCNWIHTLAKNPCALGIHTWWHVSDVFFFVFSDAFLPFLRSFSEVPSRGPSNQQKSPFKDGQVRLKIPVEPSSETKRHPASVLIVEWTFMVRDTHTQYHDSCVEEDLHSPTKNTCNPKVLFFEVYFQVAFPFVRDLILHWTFCYVLLFSKALFLANCAARMGLTWGSSQLETPMYGIFTIIYHTNKP